MAEPVKGWKAAYHAVKGAVVGSTNSLVGRIGANRRDIDVLANAVGTMINERASYSEKLKKLEERVATLEAKAAKRAKPAKKVAPRSAQKR